MLLDKGAEATNALPSILLFGADEAACFGVAQRMLGEDVAGPLRIASTVVPVQSGKKVSVEHAYSSKGTLVVNVFPQPPDGESGQHAQAGILALVREVARMPHVDDMRRRGIVLRGSENLTPQIQHALHKIIEGSTQSSLFVLIVSRVTMLDTALRSRAVAVNCNSAVSVIQSVPEWGEVDPVVSAFKKKGTSSKQRSLIQALVNGGPSAYARLIHMHKDDVNVYDIATVAAEAEHRAADTARRCPSFANSARELAARLMVEMLWGLPHYHCK